MKKEEYTYSDVSDYGLQSLRQSYLKSIQSLQKQQQQIAKTIIQIENVLHARKAPMTAPNSRGSAAVIKEKNVSVSSRVPKKIRNPKKR